MSTFIETSDTSSRKRKKDHHEPATIFSPHLAGSGTSSGVWAGGRTTNTKQSKTLFVTNIDSRLQFEQVAELFKGEPGFYAFRPVRKMAFVDFQTIPDANAAMRKYQNFRLSIGLNSFSEPILIDYDKDDRSKRDAQFARQVAREVSSQESCELVELTCKACSQFLIKLRIVEPKTFAKLPRRPIDQSLVIDTAKWMTECQLGKGEERALKRKEGIEMQYRLICKSCSLPVAYSSTPFDQSIKHLFVLDGAMRAKITTVRNGRLQRDGSAEFDVVAQTPPLPHPPLPTAASSVSASSTSAAPASSSTPTSEPRTDATTPPKHDELMTAASSTNAVEPITTTTTPLSASVSASPTRAIASDPASHNIVVDAAVEQAKDSSPKALDDASL